MDLGNDSSIQVPVVFIYIDDMELRVCLSFDRLGKLMTTLTARTTPKPEGKMDLCDKFEVVPLIPMQLVMAAAQMRAC